MRATPTSNKARCSSKLPAQIAPAAAAAQRRRPPRLITTVSRASKVALRVLRRRYGAEQPQKRRDLHSEAVAPAHPSALLPISPSNGEVEGPPRSANQAPRAHTFFPRPRRGHADRSRTSPTIVRRPVHQDPSIYPATSIFSKRTRLHRSVLRHIRDRGKHAIAQRVKSGCRGPSIPRPRGARHRIALTRRGNRKQPTKVQGS